MKQGCFSLFQFDHCSDLSHLTYCQRPFWGNLLSLSRKEVTSFVFPALDCIAGPCFLKNLIYAQDTQLCFWHFRLASHLVWAIHLHQWCHKKKQKYSWDRHSQLFFCCTCKSLPNLLDARNCKAISVSKVESLGCCSLAGPWNCSMSRSWALNKIINNIRFCSDAPSCPCHIPPFH